MDINTFQLMALEYVIFAMGIFLIFKSHLLKLRIMKLFCHFVTVLDLFLLVNIPIRHIELKLIRLDRSFTYFLYDASIGLMTFTMLFWSLFVLIHIDSCMIHTKLRVAIWSLPATVIIPLIVVNRNTGWLYTIDENGFYHRGSIFVLQAAIAYFYFAILVILCIIHIINGRNRHEAMKCLYSATPAVIGGIIQQLYGGSYLLAGTTLCALSMYVEICLERQKAFELTETRTSEIHAQEMKEIFIQTAEALSDAVDAKDPYTHGHSVRVARYSREIARAAGFSDAECDEVFFAGLLHDVGKIGIKDEILNKTGKLTSEEYAQVQQHSTYGRQILSRIDSLPYLSLGAGYHHERYDGKGYPEGLKGTDIPKIARVIAVADAYDAMTSKRSYRDPLPQQKAREELLLGSGTQFDPDFTNIMLHLIDTDLDYRMKEHMDLDDCTGTEDITYDNYRCKYSKGVLLDAKPIKLQMNCDKLDPNQPLSLAFIVFDSLDGMVHTKKNEQEDLCFFKYCEFNADGSHKIDGARVLLMEPALPEELPPPSEYDYVLTAYRQEDHIYAELSCRNKLFRITVALPDSTRYAYISMTGDNCRLYDINIDKAEEEMPPNSIQRLAEKISYIYRRDGDIPNIQIDGWRTASTKGILLKNELQVSFHTRSLPFARLIWHCPFFVLYSSADGKINGEGYQEYALLRMDGECWQDSDGAVNETEVTKGEEFIGWNDWKAKNKAGRECVITFRKQGNVITAFTSNSGIELKNTTTILDGATNIFMAITGDECVVEGIQLIETL